MYFTFCPPFFPPFPRTSKTCLLVCVCACTYVFLFTESNMGLLVIHWPFFSEINCMLNTRLNLSFLRLQLWREVYWRRYGIYWSWETSVGAIRAWFYGATYNRVQPDPWQVSFWLTVIWDYWREGEKKCRRFSKTISKSQGPHAGVATHLTMESTDLLSQWLSSLIRWGRPKTPP